MAAEPVLAVENVSVALGGVAILHRISLAFRPGIHGLIGPNGAGKSTLINAISGAVPLTSGTIRFGETVISGRRADEIAKLGISRTFQIPQSIREVNCADFIALTGAAPATVAELLARAGLRGKERVRTTELALPDLRRLEFARALAMTPKVLILDEIMAGLSDVEQRMLIELVRESTGPQTITIVVEHVMSVVRALCARTTVLMNGEILCAGVTGDVLRDRRTIEAYLGKSAA